MRLDISARFLLIFQEAVFFPSNPFRQRLAKHVMQVHLNAAQTGQAQEGELSLNFIKKYIGYCRKYVISLLEIFCGFICVSLCGVAQANSVFIF